MCTEAYPTILDNSVFEDQIYDRKHCCSSCTFMTVIARKKPQLM